MRSIVPSAALVLALLIASCGSDDESQAVRTAFGELRQDFATEDLDGLCSRLSRSARKQIGSFGHRKPRGCWIDAAEFVMTQKKSRINRRTPAPRVVEIAVDGDMATVMAILGRGSKSRVSFVKEDGRWKLDSIYGTTGPPAPDVS